MDASDHSKWRTELKDRARDVFTVLTNINHQPSKDRVMVKFESVHECNFLFHMMEQQFRPCMYKLKRDPMSMYDNCLFYDGKSMSPAEMELLILQIDHFFDHIWQHVHLHASWIMDFGSAHISYQQWSVFRCCISAYIAPTCDLNEYNRSSGGYRVDLRDVTDSIEIRRKLCPLLI